MLETLSKKLNMPLSATPVTDKKGLPVFLAYRPIFLVKSGDIAFILVELPENEGVQIRQLLSQRDAYRDAFQSEVAFSVSGISKHQRDAMIENGLPLISLPDQVYLPFLGILLQQRFHAPAQVKRFVKFTPAAQMLFLLLAYSGDQERISKSHAAKALGLTNTSITRASAMLKSVDLILEQTDGTTIWMRRPVHGPEYLKRGLSYLIDPVQEVVYVRPDQALDLLPDAGESALSAGTMLNAPAVRTKACRRKQALSMNLKRTDPSLIPDTNYIRLELWRYAPELFSKGQAVDKISLYCSLRKDPDERVEGEAERLLEEMEWA